MSRCTGRAGVWAEHLIPSKDSRALQGLACGSAQPITACLLRTVLDGEHGEAKMHALQACTVFYGFAFRIPRLNAKKRDRMRQIANRKEIAKMSGQRDFWVIGGDSLDCLPS